MKWFWGFCVGFVFLLGFWELFIFFFFSFLVWYFVVVGFFFRKEFV